MRIVGGILRGRRIPGPKHGTTRPTSERVREAIASALEARSAIGSSRVLDLYAGTGALGFEALSRGAAQAVMVDRARPVVGALRKSAQALGLSDKVDCLCLDLSTQSALERVVERGPYDLIFADPPYAMAQQLPPQLGVVARALAEDGWVVVEHDRKLTPDWEQSVLAPSATYRYGDTAVAFLRHPQAEPT